MQVRAVRITKRVQEAYFAQLYLSKALTIFALFLFSSSVLTLSTPPPPQKKERTEKMNTSKCCMTV